MTAQRNVGGRLLALGLLLCCMAALGCQADGGNRRESSSSRSRTAGAKSARQSRSLEANSVSSDEVAPFDALSDQALPNGGGDPADPAEEPAEEKPAAEEPSAPEEPAVAEEPAPQAKAAPERSVRPKKPRSPEQALLELKELGKLQMAEAEFHVQKGDEAYAQLDYKTAMEEYRKALDINPALQDVRERWARSGLVLGVRSAEIDAIHREFVEADRVRKEQRLADARLGLKEGQDLKKEGDLQNAERKLRKVYEELLWFEYPVDTADLRQQVKDEIRSLEDLQRKTAKEQRAQLEKIASKERENDLQREKRVRDQQVRELVLRASDYVRLKDYQKGIDACKRILELKPDHRIAKFWLKDLERQQTEQKMLQIIRDRAENEALMQESIKDSAISYTDIFVFPSDPQWDLVRRRKETLEVVSLEDPEWIRKIRNALDQKITFSFEQRPLKEVLPFFSQQLGINITTDPAINTEEFLIDLSAKDMRGIDALNQILTMTGLAYTFFENNLYITEKEKAKGDTTFAIYNVSDILNKIRNFEGPEIKLRPRDEGGAGGTGQGAQQQALQFGGGGAEDTGPVTAETLIELIREGSGGEEVWGEHNKMEYHKGQLLVNATKEIHQQIQNTLKNLREDSDLFVVIESRFIDITDDFLEDIGIDSRALGVGSNWGTPYGNIINNNYTGGNDIGFVKQGSPVRDVTLIMGQDRYAGRLQNIIDGFTGLITGSHLRGGPGGVSGLTAQATWLEPFQINVIFRAVQEDMDVRQLTAPIITAHNGQRVYVSVITQRAYIADYELVSGGTGFSIIEVADPVVQTFQEGVILDVQPVITPDKRYITLDVRPTMASLIGGIISTIHISLGSFTSVAFQVPIGVPQIALQQSFTSVTVPNGGTVLLGGFKSLVDAKFRSYVPVVGQIPIVKLLFSRQARILEKRSLVILITARIVDLRSDERTRYNE